MKLKNETSDNGRNEEIIKMLINTDRLNIRELLPEDWQELKHIAADFKKSEYAIYDIPLPTEDEEIKNLTKQFAMSNLFFAVFLKESSEMIGYVCFHNDDGKFDLGYCFHSDYHSKGYASESCLAVMDYLKQNYGIKLFTAGTALKNIQSCKLLNKLGFILPKTEILSFHKDKSGNDIVFESGFFIRKD